MENSRRSGLARWAIGGAAVVAALTLAVVLGLRHDPKVCDTAGLSPGSSVSLVVPDPGWTIVEFCVSGNCESSNRVPVGDDAELHPYTVSLVNGQGQAIDAAGEITTVEVQPNGEGCPPRHAYAQVAIASDGSATTSAP